MAGISPRLRDAVDALPLAPGMRILEIGCGPGVAAREVAARMGNGFVLAIDRSEKAIALAAAGSVDLVSGGRVAFRCVAVEDFELEGLAPFDLAFAIRVGALDGRHLKAGEKARERIAAALTPGGRLFVDFGGMMREVPLA